MRILKLRASDYNAELQTTTQTLRATKYSIESTYSDLPCDLKVNRGKLALINRPWKSKNGKGRRSPLVHSRKLAEHDNFTRAASRRYRDRGQRQEKIRTTLRTNQIAGFITVPSWKKIRAIIIHQTHYKKSDWSRAFNQFTIACELEMINAISAADIAFIM